MIMWLVSEAWVNEMQLLCEEYLTYCYTRVYIFPV